MKLTEFIKSCMHDEKCYVLLYTITEVKLGTYENGNLDIFDKDLSERDFLELHVFNPSKEVKLEKNGTPVEITGDDSLSKDEDMYISRNFITKYKRIKVRNYCDYTEDGIIYVKSSRFVEVF